MIWKKIVKKLRVSRLGVALKASPLGVAILRNKRNKKNLSKEKAYAVMRDFGVGDLPEEEKEKIYRDMLDCAKKFHFSFVEYFQFNLKDKTDAERSEYISDNDRVRLTEEFNDPYNLDIFENKAKTAQTFAAFFNREYLVFTDKKDAEKLAQFLKKQGTAIIKPIGSAGGHGIRIVEAGEDSRKTADALIGEFCRSKYCGGIAEELIHQDDRMKAFHAQSVNTIRVPTIRLDDRTVVFHPVLRVGRGDSVIDNTSAGGIICPLDNETGVVLAARDRAGNEYEKNPNTGEPLVGVQVPEWDSAVAFVKRLVQVVPSNRYTGWDIALSKDKGWMLVEANARGQMGSQIALQKGYRKEIDGYRKELGLPPSMNI